MLTTPANLSQEILKVARKSSVEEMRDTQTTLLNATGRRLGRGETSFEELDCWAYDLRNDPERKNAIRPLLVGPPGISKKISVPFLKPLSKNERFKITLRCLLPRRMTTGIACCLSTLSFADPEFRNASFSLNSFIGRLLGLESMQFPGAARRCSLGAWL
jgi:hypothetical protein